MATTLQTNGEKRPAKIPNANPTQTNLRGAEENGKETSQMQVKQKVRSIEKNTRP